MTTADEADLDRLLQPDRVHRSVYTDPAIFDLEMERIFGRAWIYVGHLSQAPKAGDYYATTLGRQPVLLVRQADGTARVLFNRCAHKGAQLVGDVTGNVRAFRCAYHGWTYGLDGRVKAIPLERGYAGSCFGKSDRMANMQSPPRTAEYRGFVFASLSEEAPPFDDWIRGVAGSIDNMVDRSPLGEIEVTGGVLRYLHNCNWKFFVENLNDMLHPMVAHQSASMTARDVARELYTEDAVLPPEMELLAPFTNTYEFFEEMGLHAFDYGHSYSGGQVSVHSGYSDIPGYQAALEQAHGVQGARDVLAMSRHNTVIYPSLTVKGPIQTIRVVKPLAVDQTLVESWTFRLKGAPEQLLQRSILYCTLVNSSANLIGPDDHEAYQRMQQGLLTQGSDWVSMHRNLGEEQPAEEGGVYAPGSSDLVFRNQFKAWRQYLSGGEKMQ